jgi:hypothetical protein
MSLETIAKLLMVKTQAKGSRAKRRIPQPRRQASICGRSKRTARLGDFPPPTPRLRPAGRHRQFSKDVCRGGFRPEHEVSASAAPLSNFGSIGKVERGPVPAPRAKAIRRALCEPRLRCTRTGLPTRRPSENRISGGCSRRQSRVLGRAGGLPR